MRPFLIVLLTFYVCVHAFGQIQVGVWTDKPSYRYGDTIAITITAYNPTADTIFLHFGSTCQANYIIDNFNFYNNIACAAKVTGRYIPPSGTVTWDFLKYPYSLSGWPLLSLGAHAVLGQVLGYAMSDTLLIFVTSTTSVADNNLDAKGFILDQNYPNPFNGATTIPFTISNADRVVMALYNNLGQKIRILLDDYRSIGTYTVRAELNELPSGVYWCRLQVGQRSQTTKLILSK